ncbi:hypothetical protein P8C59_004568 [Phyllachora maydis]|uniref:Uncharacterized protein n=1 Tax=Phyllachora maydis TaxID=1825666 RepID=A0AAD9MAI8_9PEZI|nr:hypothetical protein P8C59_004568 [Phyllachora maydis]
MVKKQPPGNPARNLRGSPRPGQQQQQQQQQHQHQHPPASLFTERLSLATQQRTLDLFAATFQDVLTSPAFGTTLQAIKKALFERAFARAFQQPEFLSVYAARWSPTRALWT